MTNRLSYYFGLFAKVRFPFYIQYAINYIYAKIFKVDLSHFKDLKSFKSLSELFVRELVKKPRITLDTQSLISPCDGVVTEQGIIQSGVLFQIKGKSYKLEDFLCDNKSLDGYHYINLYLSPKDYHRFHVPIDMKLKSIIYIPGSLYPVNNFALNYIDNLFVKNERVILECQDCFGDKLWFIAIGAFNVGSIVINAQQDLITNSFKKQKIYKYKKDNIELKKGDELGYFNMGSTIVMCFKNASLHTNIHSKIKFGDCIATKNAS